jgi:surfactin synthase thioesterase subunit
MTLLPERVELCLTQLPGRDSRLREAPFTRLQPLAEALCENLLLYFDKPFAFFGHSMGALIAFELARLLQRRYNCEPVHLFVSGRRAPPIPDTESPRYELSEPEFIAELRRLNGTPASVLDHPELMELLLPVIRADFAICQTYVYSSGPLLGCPISAFGGLEDRDVTREHLEAWRDQTSSSFVLRMLPGDHFFINAAQPVLLKLLSRELYSITNRLTTQRESPETPAPLT